MLLSIKHKLNRCLWAFCLCLLGFALSTAVAVAPLSSSPREYILGWYEEISHLVNHIRVGLQDRVVPSHTL